MVAATPPPHPPQPPFSVSWGRDGCLAVALLARRLGPGPGPHAANPTRRPSGGWRKPAGFELRWAWFPAPSLFSSPQWAAWVGGAGLERTLSSSIGDICLKKGGWVWEGRLTLRSAQRSPQQRPPPPTFPGDFWLRSRWRGRWGDGARAQPARPTCYHTHEISHCGGGAQCRLPLPRSPNPFTAI